MSPTTMPDQPLWIVDAGRRIPCRTPGRVHTCELEPGSEDCVAVDPFCVAVFLGVLGCVDWPGTLGAGADSLVFGAETMDRSGSHLRAAPGVLALAPGRLSRW